MDLPITKKIASFFEHNKIVFICLLILPLFTLLIPLIILTNQNLVIIPADDIGNLISAITDNQWNGNSTINEFACDKNGLVLKYSLKEGAPNPLVFTTLNLGSVENPLDLSGYDSLSLQIKEATTKRFMIFIKTFLPGVSLPGSNNAQTLRHNQYILQLIPGRHQYEIKLENFTTQSWWSESMNVNRELLPNESFRKVIAFDMQFNREGSNYIINKPESITVEKVSFHRTPSPINYILIGIIILYYLGFGGVYINKTLQMKKEKLPQRKNLELASYREKDLLRIKEFIAANYQLADISTKMIADRLGITSARVFELLKEEYHLTFKQLINKMRIDEAKRLLIETDLRITEIAMNLGFNSVSYFNNLFKRCEGEPPSDYREKRKK